MVYLNLTKSEFSAEKLNSANKEAISEMGDEDGKDSLLFDKDGDKMEISEINDDGSISVTSDGPLGYIDITVKLTDEDIINMVSMLVKRLNKFKAVLEGLKG